VKPSGTTQADAVCVHSAAVKNTKTTLVPGVTIH
jgi:hypothetical protein